MSRGGLSELSSFSSVFVVLWICANGGDIPKMQNMIVAVSSTAEVTIAIVTDGSTKQYTIPSATGNSSVRSFCHAACESSYNQLQVDDSLFTFNTYSVDIVSGLRYPGTASQQRVPIPDCDPLTATFEEVPNLFLYLLCRPGSWNNFSATIIGLQETSGSSWLATEPYSCSHSGTMSEGNAGLFFHSHDGSLYLAFASSSGLGLCNPKTVEPPVFIDYPSNCVWIAKLSQFDAGNIVAECTSGKDSQLVMAVWLFNYRSAGFTQRLPHQQYSVGQLVFSSDRLIGATWKDSTVWLKNLTESTPPSAIVAAKGRVDSVHIIGTGPAATLVIVTQGGVQQYDLHAVFDGDETATTLEGSENVLTQFDDPASPGTQVTEDEHIIIPTRKDTTYGMAVLSLNGDKPVIVEGIHPARLAFFPGDNVTIPTEPTVEDNAITVMYSIVFTGAPILIVISMGLVILLMIRKKMSTRGRSFRAVEEQSNVRSSDVMINSTGPRRPTGVSLLTNRSPPVATYTRMPPTPDDDDDSEMITINPVEAEQIDNTDQRSWAPFKDREDGDGSDRPH